MDYDLTRMGNREFEDLAVAVCAAEFGPASKVYPHGKDGGRELTYSGQLNMPNLDQKDDWAGYTVVQVKHKETVGDRAKDLQWLIAQIRAEFSLWTGEATGTKRLPMPENYLLITNVQLTGTQGVGGMDRVDAMLNGLASLMNLKGFSVWHYNTMARLIDKHAGIRKTYLGLITTGDILATLNEKLNGISIDAATALFLYSASELAEQDKIRLTRAGNGPTQEFLAQVGIDLPVVAAADSKTGNKSSPAAKTLTEIGNHPTTISSGTFAHLLVGGPGQGKSTLGQLLCQSYRVALLEGREETLRPGLRDTQLSLASHFKRIGIPTPKMRRWPIFVQLSQFSEKISGTDDYSLLRFIASKISAATPFEITAQNLHSWLRAWPWIVVLDGLDEVPEVGVRTKLMRKIDAFLDQAALEKADVLVVATTRPQGYNNELENLKPAEYRLEEFSAAQALKYGQQLIETRHQNAPGFASEIMIKLQAAASEKATRKLMGTPLQVSIMASLLEDATRAPRTRHALFNAYFATMLRRESLKSGALGQVLEDQKLHVSAIHAKAGLSLQLASEKDGSANAHFSLKELQNIATSWLESEGFEELEARELSAKLTTLATDRLVLLVEKGTDRWGFEVRSLQEFMASRALLAMEENLVINALRLLVKSSHWRNTWLFSAGKIFEDVPHLRGEVVELLREANDDTVLGISTKPGSQLAIEMLADGIAYNAPKFRRRLILLALESIGTPGLPSNTAEVISEAVQNDQSSFHALKQAVTDHLESGGIRRRITLDLLASWSTGVGPLALFARQKRHIFMAKETQELRETRTPLKSTANAMRERLQISASQSAEIALAERFIAQYDKEGPGAGSSPEKTSRLAVFDSSSTEELMTSEIAASAVFEAMAELDGRHVSSIFAIWRDILSWSQHKEVGHLLASVELIPGKFGGS